MDFLDDLLAGLQWAWQFNITFLPVNIGFDSYCDHYIISSLNKKAIEATKMVLNNENEPLNFNNRSEQKIDRLLYVTLRYLFDISQYILLPLYSFIRLFVYSFDVIHTLGLYSWLHFD